jgi:hypothetical protein
MEALSSRDQDHLLDGRSRMSVELCLTSCMNDYEPLMVQSTFAPVVAYVYAVFQADFVRQRRSLIAWC